MKTKWHERPLPAWFAPLEGGLRNFYLFMAIVGSIYSIFTIQDWKIDLDYRLRFPEAGVSLERPVTEMDYVWIWGVLALFLLVLAALVVCRYILKKGRLLHILIGAALPFWVLDTVHPFLVPRETPMFTQGQEAFGTAMMVLAHIMPAIFFSCAMALWGVLLLFALEQSLRWLGRQFAPPATAR